MPSNTDVQTGQVERVIDGDTIGMRIGDETSLVLYIGMHTLEVGDPFAGEATERNRELVRGQTATLVKDVSEADRYGRLLS